MLNSHMWLVATHIEQDRVEHFRNVLLDSVSIEGTAVKDQEVGTMNYPNLCSSP